MQGNSGSRIIMLVLMILPLPFLLFDLGLTPGLHFDEAYVIMAVRRVASGFRTHMGNTSYTAPMFQYLAWPVLKLCGYTTLPLRMISVVLNWVSFLMLFFFIKRLFRQKSVYAGVLAVFATLPAFIIYARMGTEISAFTTLFLSAGFLLLHDAFLEEKLHKTRAFTGGLMLGLSAFNHIVTIATPVALAAAGILVWRRFFIKSGRVWMAVLGVVAGFLPTIISFSRRGISLDVKRYEADLLSFNTLRDIGDLPSVLWGLIQGSYVYLRFAGENAWPVIPYLALAVVILVFARIRIKHRNPLSRIDAFLILAALLSIALVTVISPRLSLRYFLVPAYIFLVAFWYVISPVFYRGSAFSRKAAWLCVLLIVVLNVSYLSVNYFYSFSQNGGSISTFTLGRRLKETSRHFVRKDSLYRYLKDRKIRNVICDYTIRSPLRVLDGDADNFDFFKSIKRLKRIKRGQIQGKSTAIVFYRDKIIPVKRGMDRIKYFEMAGARFEKAEDFDGDFSIYINRVSF